MRTFKLNKLVRDNIVEGHEADGGVVDYVLLEGEELYKALLDKLTEEVAEMKSAETEIELAKEIADFRYLLQAIADFKNVQEKDIVNAGRKRTKTAGGFMKGHYINTVTLPADNKWAKYYASQPDRFPEVE